jgi:hypothetical protein
MQLTANGPIETFGAVGAGGFRRGQNRLTESLSGVQSGFHQEDTRRAFNREPYTAKNLMRPS